MPNRALLIKELEKYFEKRVFAIIFNPSYGNGISEGDEVYFRYFIDEIIKKEKVTDCIILLSGFGGNLRTAILCSQILREGISRYSCFIPSVACSSLSYFVLQSNKLLLGRRSILTQIDPIFSYDGDDLRAIKHLNDPNPKIREIAHAMHNPVFENLKRVIKTRPNVFSKEVAKNSQQGTEYLIKTADFWMGKDFHNSGLKFSDLERLKVVYSVVPEEIIQIAKQLVNACLEELTIEDQRFVIQTNRIEDEMYYGGFFYS